MSLTTHGRPSVNTFGAGLLLAFCAAVAPPAFACRCSPGMSLTTTYQRASRVVVGRVDKVSPHADQNGSTATVLVSQGWKGPVAHEITVDSMTTCAFPFAAGQEYLLYLYDEPEGRYYTSICAGNVVVAEAARALEWLKRHGAPSAVR